MSRRRLEVRATSATKDFMLRIKIVNRGSKYAVGEVLHLTNNEAFGLLDKGIAILSKDLTDKDMVIKSDGNPLIRPMHGGRRKRNARS